MSGTQDTNHQLSNRYLSKMFCGLLAIQHQSRNISYVHLRARIYYE